MPKWAYKTTIINLEVIAPAEFIACDEKGSCEVKGLPGGLNHFKGVLDKEGESEWELVQVEKHDDKMLLIWKKEIKEAFVS